MKTHRPGAARFITTILGAALVAIGLTWPVAPAQAAACTTPIRYASSSNTVYVGAGTWTPSQILAACPSAPLVLVDAGNKVWQLQGDLVVEKGGHLVLHGDQADEPGDVNVLRLRSRASNVKTEVSQLRAYYGRISTDSVVVTSWDDLAGAPDTNFTVPSGSPSTARGRAFVRINSFLQSGVAMESRLDIVNSTFEYLGFNAAESYGVSYKTIGCDRTPANYPTCDLVTVSGSQINSTFRNNYIGTYVWGGSGMTFSGSEYSDNTSYGLDPHDVSRDLVIDGNRFLDNGNHGLICSQRCDNLTITNNLAQDNGTPPYNGPSAQVHGIMLHRGVTNSVVAHNEVVNQPTGGGIAIFDSVGNSIHDNYLSGNKYGLRVSVGSADNVFDSNVVEDSGSYAVYMYKGSDTPAYSTTNGRPTANVFTNNAFNGSGSSIIKLTSSENNVFEANTITAPGSGVYTDSSTGNTFRANSYPNHLIFSTNGTAGTLLLAELTSIVKVAAASGHVITLTDSAGALFDVGGKKLNTTVSSTTSRIDLTSTLLGTTGTVSVAIPASRVTVATGTALAKVENASGQGQKVTLSGAAAAGAVTVSIGRLTPGNHYSVERDGDVLVADVVADGAGRVTITDPAVPGSGTAVYTAVEVP